MPILIGRRLNSLINYQRFLLLVIALVEMKRFNSFGIVALLLLPLTIFGQSGSFSLQVDNDIFNLLNQSDRYYTSGIQVGAFHESLNSSPFNTVLIGYKQGDIRLTGLTLDQGIYTPTNIYTDELLIGDRPYASYLVFGQQLITVNPKHHYRIKSSIGAGLIGRYSGGQALQNFIHSLTPYSENANGWQHQISHDIALNYGLEIEKGLIYFSWFQLNGVGKINVGTVVNRGDLGIALNTGLFEDYFQSAFSVTGVRDVNFRFYGEINLAYVLYDATLQGGVFNPNDQYTLAADQIQKERLNYKFGVQISIKQVSLEAGRIWETREFDSAMDHAWGYLKLQILIP